MRANSEAERGKLADSILQQIGGSVRIQELIAPAVESRVIALSNEGDSLDPISRGMVCLPDGSHALSSSAVAEGEYGYDPYEYGGYQYDAPESNSGESDNGRMLEVTLPAISWPDLLFEEYDGPLDNFLPSSQSTSRTVTSYGGFDENAFNAPDYSAEGLHWVHLVEQDWTSAEDWSYLERLLVVFNVGDNDADSGNINNTSDGLTETGSWARELNGEGLNFVASGKEKSILEIVGKDGWNFDGTIRSGAWLNGSGTAKTELDSTRSGEVQDDAVVIWRKRREIPLPLGTSQSTGRLLF